MLYSININTLTGSILATEKFLFYSIHDDSVARSVPTSNVGIENVDSTGQAASLVKFLCEQLPKVFVFSADKIFTTW